MFDDPTVNEFWEQPALVSRLKLVARRSRFEFGDLLSETALRRLQKELSPSDDERRVPENQIAYVVSIAERVVKERDPATLNRKRRTKLERVKKEAIAKVAAQPDRTLVSAERSELEEAIRDSLPKQCRPLLSAWIDAPDSSPVTTVAKSLGVSRPTARKRLKEVRRRLTRALLAYKNY